jgi:hypothetical protein
MFKYGVIEFTGDFGKKGRIDLYKVELTEYSFAWGDKKELSECIVLYLVSYIEPKPNDDYKYILLTSFKTGEKIKVYADSIQEFEDDETAKLWFKLNY